MNHRNLSEMCLRLQNTVMYQVFNFLAAQRNIVHESEERRFNDARRL